MIDDSHALTTFFFFSLSRSLSHAGTDERGISSRTRLDRKHRTCGQSQPRQLSNNGERCSQGVKNQTFFRQPREQFLALTALECLMKNCGPDFHEMMLSKGLETHGIAYDDESNESYFAFNR